MKVIDTADRAERARRGLVELRVNPERAATLVEGLDGARNCFYAWALLLMHTKLSPLKCKRFLEEHDYYPGREAS